MYTNMNTQHAPCTMHTHTHTLHTLCQPQFTELAVLLIVVAIMNSWFCRYFHRNGATQCSIVKKNLGVGKW